ncbi:hypothetical protein MTQ93_09665 [Staphylococcus agnetis]|uniref:FtsK/SpoIIIE domain-containing protein n=1 Tax=Staphylococcus agnetis TaxID=985762 RepID=UPI00208EADD0|nr:FtsK/SpoIIIE domain-containing protein [Staphylococcus agnetis]MCO4346311.1 hypothetical protein [Staphylococcus agnetis]MCO4360613.1 hypothetical protein [Staphylococcus agnetis]
MQAIMKTRCENPTQAIIGITTEGEAYSITISKGPHWLVAGSSGSGKSALLKASLITMLQHAHPIELELVIIDPKTVEFGTWKGIPHLRIPPVIDMQEAEYVLLYMIEVMEYRYKLMEEVGVNNIEEYNELVVNLDPKVSELPHGLFRYVVIVIDEYADFMAEVPEVEDLIKRLGAKARAAGISLVISTQRPSVDVISPTLKANIQGRIGLKTTDSANSHIIMGDMGQLDLSNLTGLGDSIVRDHEGNLTRVLGLYVPSNNINNIMDALRETYGKSQEYDYKKYLVDKGIIDE